MLLIESIAPPSPMEANAEMIRDECSKLDW